MSLLQSRPILVTEANIIALIARTFLKAARVNTLDYKNELPNRVRQEFRSRTFALQLDKLIAELILQSFSYADTQAKQLTAAAPILNPSYVLTEEAVRLSGELSKECAESVVRMLVEDAIYYESPRALANRITDLWGNEKYRAERFARTFTADVATASTVSRYRALGIRYMEFNAEVDDKTTAQCRCLDGTIFDLEKGSVDAYRPPLHQHCVVAGTLVKTIHMDKRIEDIRIGDMALTHLGHYMPVTETMTRFPDELIDLHTSSYHVRITPNHPILQWDMFNGVYCWVDAGGLREGDMICTASGYEFVSVVQGCETEQVFNISVQEDESYIANGIVVHNCRSGLIPITEDEYDKSREFENRDFSGALENQEEVDRAFKQIGKFNDNYRVSKLIIDKDLAARYMFEKGFSVSIETP